jgi:hypothetical protein
LCAAIDEAEYRPAVALPRLGSHLPHDQFPIDDVVELGSVRLIGDGYLEPVVLLESAAIEISLHRVAGAE